ncbi:hypothetical protein Daus18300_012234 [Diaporthe australafricana]|uniref:Uncharacterized protein n=1 Tax=Diaporthe australafricana TaxID=127596 RepID=A0ABR3W3E9_9PEZI
MRHHNLGAVLHALPPAALPLLRRLTIFLTPVQCYYWFGRAPDWDHPEWALRDIVKSEPDWPGEEDDKSVGPVMLPARASYYRADLRAVLARLAAEAGPSRFDLELDLQAVHAFSGLFLGDNEPDEEDRFRWTYDLCIDVAEMVCAKLPGLRGVRFRLATYADLEQWLAREVLGERFLGSVEPPNGRRRPLAEKLPSYHRMN